MKKKACKQCKYLYEGEQCSSCGSSQSVQNWKGRINIISLEHSEIAKKIGISKEGEYAIKVS
jgi:DNA-directed RNA polymerase subunit E"